MVGSAAVGAEAENPFALSHLMPAKALSPNGTLRVDVSTTGAPLPLQELTKPDNWRIAFLDATGNHPVSVQAAAWDPSTKVVTLRVGGSLPAAPAASGWRVVFIGSELLSAAVKPASIPGLKAAKGKKDAAFYFLGSTLWGRSTKPIYVIDAKVDYADEIRTTGWQWHVTGTISTNTNAEPPVDRVRIDPDTITAALGFSKTLNVNAHGLYGIELKIDPVNGEFTRKDRLADVVTAGEMRFVLAPVRHRASFQPSIGYELGHALWKPEEVANRAVDLSKWNAIARAVLGGSMQLYFFKAEPTEDDWYHVTFEVNYTGRVPFASEPFVEPALVEGKREAVTTVKKNVRHNVELSANWNAMKFVGVQVQYKYGALPPLFQLVDHQVVMGITVKAARE
jgi:hypothetical protein